MKTTRHSNHQRPLAIAALALLAPVLMHAQPDNATLRKAVARDLSTQSGSYYEMSNLSLESANIAPVDKTTAKAEGTSIHYTATVTGTLTQPFYYSVPTYEYIESIMQVNPSPAREAAQALQGPDAEKLRALAGKDATTANLSSLHLIHETVPAGTPREFAATVTAVAQGKDWLINSTFSPKTPPPQGAPITSYGNNALSIDDVSSVVTIHEKVADALAASNRILALQKQMGTSSTPATVQTAQSTQTAPSASPAQTTVVTNNIVVPVVVAETKTSAIATAPVVVTPAVAATASLPTPTRPAATTTTTTYVTPAASYSAPAPTPAQTNVSVYAPVSTTTVYNAPAQPYAPRNPGRRNHDNNRLCARTHARKRRHHRLRNPALTHRAGKRRTRLRLHLERQRMDAPAA